MMQIKKDKLRGKDIIFLVSALTLPILQFIIFYVVVNGSSIMMAFQKVENGKYVFNGFNTIAEAMELLFSNIDYRSVLKNSFVMYLITQVLAQVIATFFAFCIWKKIRGFKFFSSVLFLPSVIASIVFVMIARECVNVFLPKALNDPSIAEWLNEQGSGFIVSTCYGMFLSFGSNLILQLGAMSGVDTSVVEYGEIDGVNTWQQFRYIVFPHIWPTLISLFVIGLASVFTNQGLGISFYGAQMEKPSVQTFSAYIYVKVLNEWGNDMNTGTFPIYSAMGLMMSVVVVVVSVLGRKLLEKYGPSEE